MNDFFIKFLKFSELSSPKTNILSLLNPVSSVEFEFVKETLKYYNLYYPVNYYKDYDEAKEYLKRLENKIRRGR